VLLDQCRRDLEAEEAAVAQLDLRDGRLEILDVPAELRVGRVEECGEAVPAVEVVLGHAAEESSGS